MASTAVTAMWALLFVLLFFGATAACMVATSHCLRTHCMRDLPPAPGPRRAASLRPRERLEGGGSGDCEAPPPPTRKWMGVIVENPAGEKTLGKV